MNISKLFSLLILICVGVVAYQTLLGPPPQRPLNGAVDEKHFGRLQEGMSEVQVEQLFGLPHQTTGGVVVQMEVPDRVELRLSIEPCPREPGGHTLNVYQGYEQEAIKVLFSGAERRLLAAEYDVAGYWAGYRGVPIAGASRPLMSGQSLNLNDAQLKKELSPTVYSRLKEVRLNLQALALTYVRPPVDAPPQTAAPPANVASADSPAAVDSAVGIPAGNPTSDTCVVAPAPQPAVKIADGGSDAPVEKPADGAAPVLRLPSGRTLNEELFAMPKDWQQNWFPDASVIYVGTYPNGSVRGVFTLKGIHLEGPAATLYEDGQLAAAGKYAAADPDGAVRLWEPHRKRLLYAEYCRGKKNGLWCVFRDGQPWLVEEWNRDNLSHAYLVVGDKQHKPAVIQEAMLSDRQLDEFHAAQDRRDELGLQVKDDARQINRWLHEEAERLRRRRYAALHLVGRGASGGSAGQANAYAPSNVEDLWRRALNNCGM